MAAAPAARSARRTFARCRPLRSPEGARRELIANGRKPQQPTLETRTRSRLASRPGEPRVIIDVFNHFVPSAYFERLRVLVPDHAAATAFPRLRALWDLDARLKLLDGFGDYAQVLSLANPPLEHLAALADTVELARIANDGLAELTRRHPDRFPAFIASLPMNDVDATLREIDRAVND